MYDIKIFIEDNWKVWARLNAWKDLVYAVWNNYIDFITNLKEELEFCFWN